MADAAVKVLNDLKKAKADIEKKCYPAFDELLLYSLARQHLDVPEISQILLQPPKDAPLLQDHLKNNVRLLKIEEIVFDKSEDIHLGGVESVISSMRGRGHSLLFIVQGDSVRTSVYLGLTKFAENSSDINSAIESYAAVWKSNFPGSQLNNLTTNEISDVSYNLADCKHFGVLTGIPSLKREEDANSFVQGLERLIRAMRGKTYCWISIADPIPQDIVREAISQCQALQGEIHRIVKTDLSKATSNGKTIMLGMFGMLGQGETEGSAKTDSETETKGTSEADTHTRERSINQSINYGITGVVSGSTSLSFSNAYSKMKSSMESLAKGMANTLSQSVSKQMGGGMFSSFGMTWTKTTTVGQELLNRKAEYAEEILKAYEERLQGGTALGMWNLGHYFCAADEATYNQGSGVVTSLFSGMNSIYEPPRAIRVSEGFRDILRRFNNVYLQFETTENDGKKTNKYLSNHPLGKIFNGPTTPVNTKELAIATPIATQDVEGITVNERASFGINVPQENKQDATLSLGFIMDKGNETKQRYRLSLDRLPKHLAVFGLTGSGKTNTVHNLLVQLWKNYKIPFMVIEPAKSEYRALSMTDELKNDLLVISAGVNQTSACPLRLNPFTFDPGKDNDANRVHLLTHIDRLKATFNASFPMYASMPYILEEAILEIYRERGWDLGRSCNRFIDIYKEDFSAYVPTLQDLYLKVKTIVEKKGYFQEQQMNIQAALQARLSSLMVGSKGEMLNCARSISAADLFSRPVVIELENMGDDDEKAFLMGLLVSKLYEYRKATATAKQEEKYPFKHVLVIEEAHRLLANIPDSSANMEVANTRGKAVSSFVDMLSEIRALGESVFIVDQLPSRVSPNIVKGTGAKIIHRLLAKDDREAVGWTMGLNEDQIDDLCLLKTGECVVSQDGDRKAYMCKVGKNETHENRNGDEISEATTNFKNQNATMFENIAVNIDLEDMRFRDNLYKSMLLIGIGESPAKLLAPFANTVEQSQVYWRHICREIWAFYGGSYQNYLAMLDCGYLLLDETGKTADAYKLAFSSYFETTKTYRQAQSITVIATAYQQLLLRNEVMATINRNFDLVRNCNDSVKKLAISIRKVLPGLLPSNAEVSSTIKNKIVEEILALIPRDISLNEILSAMQD